MDLETALSEFDATDANIRRLEQIWAEMQTLIPSGIAFVGGSPDDERYRELSWAWDEIAKALPAIDGYRIASAPMELDAIAQARLDAAELGEIEITVSVDDSVARPGRELAEYRFRFDRARRNLVRGNVATVSLRIEQLLADLTSRHPRDGQEVVDRMWDELVREFSQIERLAGPQVPRSSKSWSDLQRHVAFSQGQDLHDIAARDWPAVRAELQRNLYSELEPLPVSVQDLGDVVALKPSGPVTTELDWNSLDGESFERLLYNLIVDAPEYENVQWLTRTNAPDRGRDISAERVRADSLSGTMRERVIFQAKHWLAKSVGVDDVTKALAQMQLWEPPPVHVLVIATSGRFSTDGVAWIEGRNGKDERPRIEMWPNSHLLLARRPHIAAPFNIRG